MCTFMGKLVQLGLPSKIIDPNYCGACKVCSRFCRFLHVSMLYIVRMMAEANMLPNTSLKSETWLFP